MSEDNQHHVMPLQVYFGVFGALMVLTVITVLVSYADLGPASLGVAMGVALIKAGFVAGYFMHLKYDSKLHQFTFFGGLIFIAIYFVLTFMDLGTRREVLPETGTFDRRQEMANTVAEGQAKAAADKAKKAAPAAKPEPKKTEPAKPEPAKKADPDTNKKAAPANGAAPAKAEPAKAEPAKPAPAKAAEPAKAAPAKAPAPAKAAPAKAPAPKPANP